MEGSASKFWRDYLSGLPASLAREQMPVDVFAFGDSREMADQLAMLVREGVKTATCSALWHYEEEGKPLPQTGDFSITSWNEGSVPGSWIACFTRARIKN